MDISVSSAMPMPFTRTARLLGFSRVPWQAGHVDGDMYSISHSR